MPTKFHQKNLFLRVFVFTMVCIWGCACQSAKPSPIDEVTLVAPTDTPSGNLDPADFTSLITKAAQTGNVRVIVTLALEPPFQPEGNLPDEAAVKAQRETIRDTQEALLEALKSNSFSVDFQSDFTPQIILTVDEPGLNAIIASPMVLTLQEDTPDHPSP